MIQPVIHGNVVEGKKRGKQLGFPTANFPLTQHVADGIYVSQTTIDNNQYNSVTFIGVAETFGETKRNVETYILDFDETMYGKEIWVTLLKKIRENQKFSSQEALVAQIQEDVAAARAFFET